MTDAPALFVAETPADYAAFADLCRAYLDWCRERYAAMPWFVEEIFGYQALEAELDGLARKYGPPAGLTILARVDGVVVGGGAIRRLSDETCELKRLYVDATARGLGLGRTLSAALIDAARAQGFCTMQLDTGHLLTEAQAMYAAMGFRHIPPYHAYPERLRPYLVFMEKTLRRDRGARDSQVR